MKFLVEFSVCSALASFSMLPPEVKSIRKSTIASESQGERRRFPLSQDLVPLVSLCCRLVFFAF